MDGRALSHEHKKVHFTGVFYHQVPGKSCLWQTHSQNSWDLGGIWISTMLLFSFSRRLCTVKSLKVRKRKLIEFWRFYECSATFSFVCHQLFDVFQKFHWSFSPPAAFWVLFSKSRWNRVAGRCIDIVTLISAENHFLIKSLRYFLDSVSQWKIWWEWFVFKAKGNGKGMKLR